MLAFWHAEIPEMEDDFMSDEEIESAFVTWWAAVLHDLWVTWGAEPCPDMSRNKPTKER
jgi:hypothetical protein